MTQNVENSQKIEGKGQNQTANDAIVYEASDCENKQKKPRKYKKRTMFLVGFCWLFIAFSVVILGISAALVFYSNSARDMLDEMLDERTIETITLDEKDYRVMNELETSPYEYLDILPIDYQEGIEEWENGKIAYVLSETPEEVLRILSERGWKIHVDDTIGNDGIPVLDPDLEGQACGLAFGPTKEIWLIPDASSSLAAHEFGHAIDWELGYESFGSEFQEIHWFSENLGEQKEAKKNELGDTFIGDVKIPNSVEEICDRSGNVEQWANAFTLYCCYPKTLLNEYPDCYLYFASLFGIRGLEIEQSAEIVATIEQARTNAQLYPRVVYQENKQDDMIKKLTLSSVLRQLQQYLEELGYDIGDTPIDETAIELATNNSQ